MPLSGSGSDFLADANAIAGESRPGSWSAARLPFRVGRPVGSGARCCRRTGRSRDILLDSGDQVLQIVGLPGQLHRTGALGVERLLGFGLFALALLDEHGHPCSFLRKCGEITTEHLTFGRYFATYFHEFGKISDQRVDLDLHVGQHGTEQYRGPYRLEGIFRAHHQGWRGPAADPLQGCQDLRNDGAAAAKRAAHRILVRLQRPQPGFGCGDAILDRTDIGGRADQ